MIAARLLCSRVPGDSRDGPGGIVFVRVVFIAAVIAAAGFGLAPMAVADADAES
jgi:hypothetical protein